MTTTQSLFRSVERYTDIKSKVSIDSAVINHDQIIFGITDQDGKPVDIGKVLLECYIM